MSSIQTPLFRFVSLMVAAAALAGTAAGSAGAAPPNPALRNDIGHFGTTTAGTELDNRIRWNDNAHFGTDAMRTDDQSRAPIVVRVDGGFDWVSAGVGAVGGLGLVLVAGAAASTLRRRHRIDTARA